MQALPLFLAFLGTVAHAADPIWPFHRVDRYSRDVDLPCSEVLSQVVLNDHNLREIWPNAASDARARQVITDRLLEIGHPVGHYLMRAKAREDALTQGNFRKSADLAHQQNIRGVEDSISGEDFLGDYSMWKGVAPLLDDLGVWVGLSFWNHEGFIEFMQSPGMGEVLQKLSLHAFKFFSHEPEPALRQAWVAAFNTLAETKQVRFLNLGSSPPRSMSTAPLAERFTLSALATKALSESLQSLTFDLHTEIAQTLLAKINTFKGIQFLRVTSANVMDMADIHLPRLTHLSLWPMRAAREDGEGGQVGLGPLIRRHPTLQALSVYQGTDNNDQWIHEIPQAVSTHPRIVALRIPMPRKELLPVLLRAPHLRSLILQAGHDVTFDPKTAVALGQKKGLEHLEISYNGSTRGNAIQQHLSPLVKAVAANPSMRTFSVGSLGYAWISMVHFSPEDLKVLATSQSLELVAGATDADPRSLKWGKQFREFLTKEASYGKAAAAPDLRLFEEAVRPLNEYFWWGYNPWSDL